MSLTVRPSDPVAAGELGRACGVGPAVGQVLLHRGLQDPESARGFLDPRLSGLTAPEAMADRAAAVDRLLHAVRRRERIVVFGDYDVDGTTATAVLTDVLEALGADVLPLLASRFDGGYGLSDAALERCLGAGARVLVTCDCGSSDHPRIAEARRRGVDVIVIDHHLVPADPLPAFAFLNPHRPDCGFPFDGLASVGLALVVAAGLRQAAGVRLDLRPSLDLVALGTIADVAPLAGDNRTLVRAGLQRLRAPDPRPGVAALRALAVRYPGQVGARDVAFGFAPRLNAPGRLGDPTPGLRLLRSRSMAEARALAAEVERANLERRRIERALTAEALAQVQAAYGPRPEAGLLVWGEGWHPGVLGIVAARIVDAHRLPALAVSVDPETGRARGSGRAPAGWDVHAALGRCADQLSAFGGHAAACGLELPASDLGALRAAFGEAVGAGAPGASGDTGLVDVVLDGHAFPVPDASELDRLEPLGAANPDPLFLVEDARVETAREVGDGGAHLAIELRLGRRRLRAFAPGGGPGPDGAGPESPAPGDRVTVAGHLAPDGYRGGDAVELRVRYLDRRVSQPSRPASISAVSP